VCVKAGRKGLEKKSIKREKGGRSNFITGSCNRFQGDVAARRPDGVSTSGLGKKKGGMQDHRKGQVWEKEKIMGGRLL